MSTIPIRSDVLSRTRPVLCGLDVVRTHIPPAWRQGWVGVLTNRAAVTWDGVDCSTALRRAGVRRMILLTPEHGWSAQVPPGVPVPDQGMADGEVPVYSLYGPRREPPEEVMARLSHVVVDLPDVGARYYTYASTLFYLMRAAARWGLPVTVLDRPNPVTGVHVEGPMRRPAFRSFVSLAPVPVRHGLTLGELALLLNEEEGVGCALDVVPAQGWRREMWWDATGLPWVPPSPNMPDPLTALVYLGTCLFEGTDFSEGRGTPAPFRLVGAPWVDGEAWARRLEACRLPGVTFRPARFVPSASKHAHRVCEGVEVIVQDRDAFRPVRTGIAMLTTAWEVTDGRVGFRRRPDGGYVLDYLIGTDAVRRGIAAGASWEDITASWASEEERFRVGRRSYLLYEEAED